MEDNQVFTGDILIDGKIIAKIAPDIPVENEDWEVINADGKLVSPALLTPTAIWACRRKPSDLRETMSMR